MFGWFKKNKLIGFCELCSFDEHGTYKSASGFWMGGIVLYKNNCDGCHKMIADLENAYMVNRHQFNKIKQEKKIMSDKCMHYSFQKNVMGHPWHECKNRKEEKIQQDMKDFLSSINYLKSRQHEKEMKHPCGGRHYEKGEAEYWVECSICAELELAKKENQEKIIKHPCGKVFDMSKPFKAFNGNEVKDFACTKSFIFIEGESSSTEYFKCGHKKYNYSFYNVDHEDTPYDLINIDQLIDWNKPICVVDEISGEQFSASVEKIYKTYARVEFYRDGYIWNILFSLDAKESSVDFIFMKFIAKNV